MDTVWADIIGAAATVIVLAVAAYFDWRDREVPDACWWILGTTGIILTGMKVLSDGFDAGYLMMLIGSFMILADIALDRERPAAVSAVFYIVMAAMFIIPLFLERGDRLGTLYVIPVCFILFYLLYIIGILKGGADAKCFMVVAMVFQTYPSFLGMPLINLPAERAMLIISFPLALLFHAALFAVIGGLVYGICNILRDGLPAGIGSFFWKKMSIEEARVSYVWPKQDIVDGELCFISGTSDDEAVLDRLETAGHSDVWVTPIVPFMVPTFVASVFILTVGNLLFIL